MPTMPPRAYNNFLHRLELLIAKNPRLITNTLSNIFTMRLIGNKAHGDLGEIGIAEFVNQFMYDYEAKHVGKDLFRAKNSEEDILVRSLVDQEEAAISLKAYGDGPLQLSTDKNTVMFPLLESLGSHEIHSRETIDGIYNQDAFRQFGTINVLPLIYREKDMQCNIMIFDAEKARKATSRIVRLDTTAGRGRKHPIWRFEDKDGNYISEVRYGSASANALQRGFWTHTKNALPYFRSITGGWIDYSHNLVLVELFAKALNSSKTGHEQALSLITEDLERIKSGDQSI